MKVAILTQALRYNFGGILQNYALQTVLRRMGHDVVTLDPRRYKYPEWKYRWMHRCNVLKRRFLGHVNPEYKKELKIRQRTQTYGTHTFPFIDNYIRRKEYGDLTKEIGSRDYVAYIVGSDQVWRPKYNKWYTQLGNMFLDFTQGWDVRRISYAASFGTEEWEFTSEETQMGKTLLAHFDAVSVREDSGISLCRQYFDKEAVHVLDPTLLLDKSDYSTLINQSTAKGKPGDLYVYILDETEQSQRLLQDMAQEKGLTPYTYNSRVNDANRDSHELADKVQPPVELWLKGFDQAKYVITDSFHACVFSIIFQKQFFLLTNEDRGLSRYRSLFNLLGTGDRCVKNLSDVDKMGEIDYNQVSQRLEKLRGDSMLFLERALAG